MKLQKPSGSGVLSAAHILGVENVEADRLSWSAHADTEWKLDTSLLLEALVILGSDPTIDLFATRVNFKFSVYVANRPDPSACAIDAFTVNWSDCTFYAFPPFSILPMVLGKIIRDKARGTVIVPHWKNQTFWPILTKLLMDRPVLLLARDTLLVQPSNPEMTPTEKETCTSGLQSV